MFCRSLRSTWHSTLHREPDKLTVRWSGSKEVTILCEGCGEITQGSEKWREIALKYELR